MPQNKKPTRLWFNRKRGLYFILTRANGKRKQIPTGCGAGELGRAEEILKDYLAGRGEASQRVARDGLTDWGEHNPYELKIIHVLTLYQYKRAPHLANETAALGFLKPLMQWWGKKVVADIKGASCRAYTRSRTTEQMARRELETLRAALNFYDKEYGLDRIPRVTLPPKAKSREFWATRSQFATALRYARRRGAKHLERYLLIGVYVGSRKGAILALQWHANTESAYVDLEKGVMFRAGEDEKVAENKRRPPARIPAKLLRHMKRWWKEDRPDKNKKLRHIVHYRGEELADISGAWGRMIKRTGLPKAFTPHTLRHSAATWRIQRGQSYAAVGGFLGMDADMVEKVYSHQHPDFQKDVADAI